MQHAADKQLTKGNPLIVIRRNIYSSGIKEILLLCDASAYPMSDCSTIYVEYFHYPLVLTKSVRTRALK